MRWAWKLGEGVRAGTRAARAAAGKDGAERAVGRGMAYDVPEPKLVDQSRMEICGRRRSCSRGHIDPQAIMRMSR